MKKLYYEFPTVEVVDVKVEGGFQLSGQGGAYDPGAEEEDMEEDLEGV